jgi:hypothetical protein
MADNVPIKSGWLTGAAAKVASDPFYYFQDGEWKCVLMASSKVVMRIVNKTKKETFEDTVNNAVKANPRLRLVTNGSYFPCHNKLLAQEPTNPIYGDVYDAPLHLVIRGVALSDGDDAGCLYFSACDLDATPQGFTIEIGAPPATCYAGLGCLVPLIIKSTKIDDTNHRYKGAKAYGDLPSTGRMIVARSKDGEYLLVMAQHHGTKAGLNIGGLRDKLFDADMGDAVMLDGSDSVMMCFDGTWQENQSMFKNHETRVGVGFCPRNPDGDCWVHMMR